MWPAGLSENECHSIATEGVMPNRKQITEPKATAVGHRDPCGKQDSPRAGVSAAPKARRHRHQVTNLNVAPRSRQGKRALDATNRLCTIVHYQPVSEGCPPKGDQHPAVVQNCGRGEAMESLSQVAVNVLDGQVGSRPGQPLGQNPELLNVAGASPNLHRVVKSELGESHGGASFGGDLSPDRRGVETPLGNRYNPNMLTRTPSSIVYGTLTGALAGEHKILRLAFLAALTVALFLNRSGVVLTLLVLGQLGGPIKEVFRGRTP